MPINKKSRTDLLSKEIDLAELEWWNENAKLISKVWEMDPKISWIIRKHYLLSAKDFFLENRKNARILEIGCGSGWVGQFIAGGNIHIIGTDFSKEQIALAQKNAEQKNLQNHCDYIVLNSDTFPENIGEIDGVLIHCILHHLDNNEIKVFFDKLKSHVKPGTKIYIYEPAFYHRESNDVPRLDLITKSLMFFSNIIEFTIVVFSEKLRIIDTKTNNEYLLLLKNAENKGYYLSPKEIPLEINNFRIFLSQNFLIKRESWKTIYLIGWAYPINIIKMKFLRNLFAVTLLPFLSFTDNRLSKKTQYLSKEMVEPKYGFYVWECVMK